MAAAKRVLLATTNPAKQAKLRWLLDGSGLHIVVPAEMGISVITAEEAPNHRAIAEAKAMAWLREAGMTTISSDGGLVIPALGERWEAPRTGRAAGAGASDRQRIEHLLGLMKPYSGRQRAAHWVEAVAIADRGRVLRSWQARSPTGLITDHYDPAQVVSGFWAFSVWYLPKAGKTYADLTQEEQERIDDHWTRLRRRVRAFLQARGTTGDSVCRRRSTRGIT